MPVRPPQRNRHRVDHNLKGVGYRPRPAAAPSAQSEALHASPPAPLVERMQGAANARGLSLPGPAKSRSATTELRGARQC